MLNKRGMSFGTIVATFGAILIALGVAWLIAINWHVMPSVLKILILLLATSGAYIAGTFFRIYDYRGIGGSLLVLGALLYTWSIFLIAQIFSTSVSVQGTAFLLLIAWIGVIIASYIFDSPFSLVIGMAEFLVWLTAQYFAFSELFQREISFGLLALMYLVAGILFYGLNLLHKSREHKFSGVYQLWSIFYFLTFAYILSFQSLLPMIWPGGIAFPAASLIFFIIFAVISIGIFIAGAFMSVSNKNVSTIEILAFLGITLLLIVVIILASLVSSSLGSCNVKSCYELTTKTSCENTQLPNDKVCSWDNGDCGQLSSNCYLYRNKSSCESAPAKLKCVWNNTTINGYCEEISRRTYDYQVQQESNKICTQYANNRKACLSNDVCRWDAGSFYSYYGFGRGRSIPFSLWALWIFDNIVFILLILSIIGYGTGHKSSRLVNLGISFFALDIITRYIGFVLDFWGYTSLSIFFIIGGIILIFGGWLIEKWRRKLIAKARELPKARNM